MPVEPEPITTLPESPATLGCDQGCERRNDWGVAPCPIDPWSVVRRSPKSNCATGPLNRETIHRDEMGDDLPPLSGLQSFFAMTSFSAAFSSDRSA